MRKAVNNREYSGGEASRLIESLFLLSSESLKDVQTSAMLSDKERVSDDAIGLNHRLLMIGNKRRKITHDGPDSLIMKGQSETSNFPAYSLESAGEEGTIMRKQGFCGGMIGAAVGKLYEESQAEHTPLEQSMKKKRHNKNIDKAVSFKKASDFIENSASIRRSNRIKDKTESDVC